MKFPSQTEAELDKGAGLLAAGEYVMDVVKATDTQSKSGNDMIALELQVCNSSKGKWIRDWLVSKDVEPCIRKIRHFCVSAGLMEHYESGNLNALHCDCSRVLVKLDIEQSSGQYPAKNVVVDYLPYDGEQPGKTNKEPVDDSDIPFSWALLLLPTLAGLLT